MPAWLAFGLELKHALPSPKGEGFTHFVVSPLSHVWEIRLTIFGPPTSVTWLWSFGGRLCTLFHYFCQEKLFIFLSSYENN
jgi:hypothetical protein